MKKNYIIKGKNIETSFFASPARVHHLALCYESMGIENIRIFEIPNDGGPGGQGVTTKEFASYIVSTEGNYLEKLKTMKPAHSQAKANENLEEENGNGNLIIKLPIKK